MKRDPMLFEHYGNPRLAEIAVYRETGGYRALEKIVGGKTPPAEVIETVKASGLRGRGGAGFSTGLKCSFVPKDSPKPRYLVVNADESEPGTFKDRELMTRNPHQLVEGIVLAAYAIRAATAYVYLRGEFAYLLPGLERALEEARAAEREIAAGISSATSISEPAPTSAARRPPS